MKTLFFICLLLPFATQSGTPTENNLHVYRYLNLIESDVTIISNMFGIPKQLIQAQAAQESGFGTSYICQHYCNHVGIKNGFFDSQFECFLRYAEILVSSKCYQNLQPKSLEEWLEALVCCGYASDSNYTKSLKIIIEKYLK